MHFPLASPKNLLHHTLEDITAPLLDPRALSAIQKSFLGSFAITFVLTSGNVTFAMTASVIASQISYVSTYLMSKIQQSAATHPWIGKYRFMLIAIPFPLWTTSRQWMGHPLVFPIACTLWIASHVFWAWYSQVSLEALCQPKRCLFVMF